MTVLLGHSALACNCLPLSGITPLPSQPSPGLSPFLCFTGSAAVSQVRHVCPLLVCPETASNQAPSLLPENSQDLCSMTVSPPDPWVLFWGWGGAAGGTMRSVCWPEGNVRRAATGQDTLKVIGRPARGPTASGSLQMASGRVWSHMLHVSVVLAASEE